LLHGYGGNYKYFRVIFDIKNTLDEMISSGEIQPMVVIMPDADDNFGGSFYTNSPTDSFRTGIDTTIIPPDTTIDTLVVPPETTYVVGDTLIDTTWFVGSFTGNFENYIVNDLMPYITHNFNVDTTTGGRGVSGHSMGGYGAYKMTMNHPELFGSISSMSAPLAFQGLTALFPTVFGENGFNPADTLDGDGLRSDSLIAIRDSIFYAIAPSSRKRLTSMMFAMGAAFSPHEVYNPDTTLFHRVVRTQLFIGVDLPFKINGNLDSTFWAEKWLANDITTMLTSGGYVALQGKALYLDCGNADDIGLQYQNRGFDQALTAVNLPHTYTEYAGYPNTPADHNRFIADRLREVLKFHSQAFANR
jgi:hypothetical protein